MLRTTGTSLATIVGTFHARLVQTGVDVFAEFRRPDAQVFVLLDEPLAARNLTAQPFGRSGLPEPVVAVPDDLAAIQSIVNDRVQSRPAPSPVLPLAAAFLAIPVRSGRGDVALVQVLRDGDQPFAVRVPLADLQCDRRGLRIDDLPELRVRVIRIDCFGLVAVGATTGTKSLQLAGVITKS